MIAMDRDLFSAPDLLVAAYALPPLALPPQAVPPGTRCAFSGAPITAGYRVGDAIANIGGSTVNQFAGNVTGWVSEAAARCFRSVNPVAGSSPLARSLAVFAPADGAVVGLAPMIARKSAQAQGRPCWSELVCAVWPGRRGQVCALLITTDHKRRLWPELRVGALGTVTPLRCYDTATHLDAVLTVDWTRLIACLEVVERIYTAGFGKPSLRGGLLGHYTAAQRAGLGQAVRWERELQEWRGRPEFAPAVLIAQQKEEALQ